MEIESRIGTRNYGPMLTLEPQADCPATARLVDGASYHAVNGKIDRLEVVYEDSLPNHETEHPADHLHTRKPLASEAAVPTSTSSHAALLRYY